MVIRVNFQCLQYFSLIPRCISTAIKCWFSIIFLQFFHLIFKLDWIWQFFVMCWKSCVRTESLELLKPILLSVNNVMHMRKWVGNPRNIDLEHDPIKKNLVLIVGSDYTANTRNTAWALECSEYFVMTVRMICVILGFLTITDCVYSAQLQ